MIQTHSRFIDTSLHCSFTGSILPSLAGTQAYLALGWKDSVILTLYKYQVRSAASPHSLQLIIIAGSNGGSNDCRTQPSPATPFPSIDRSVESDDCQLVLTSF